MKIIFLLLTLISGLVSQTRGQEMTSDSVRIKVDVQPEFPGGMKALSKYVDGRKNHKYPEEARKNKVEGTVVVKFIINEDGRCSNFEVVKGIGYGCDEAAVEAFKKMPNWRPALVDGKPVKVERHITYLYRL